MALATQCPHCGTMFRVASDQLKLRGGIVRCGACQEIFDGSAILIDLDKLAARTGESQVATSAATSAPTPAAAPAVPKPAAVPPRLPAEAPAAEAALPAPLPLIADAPALPLVDEKAREAVLADMRAEGISDDTPIYTLDLNHTFDPFGILPNTASPVADEAAAAPEPAAPSAAPAKKADPGLDRFAEVDMWLAAMPPATLPAAPEVNEPPPAPPKPASLLDLVAFTVPDPLAPAVPLTWPDAVANPRAAAAPKPVAQAFPQIEPAFVPETLPDAVPAVAPATGPNTTPDAVPEATPEIVPEAVPSTVPDAVPSAVPDAVPDAEPVVALDTVSEVVPETVPEAVPEAAETVPDPVPEVVPEMVSDPVPEIVPETISDPVPEVVLETVPAPVPEVVPETVPAPVLEVEPEPVPSPAPETEPETIPDTVPDAVPGAVPDAVSDAVPDTVAQAEADVIAHAGEDATVSASVAPVADAVAVPLPDFTAESQDIAAAHTVPAPLSAPADTEAQPADAIATPAVSTADMVTADAGPALPEPAAEDTAVPETPAPAAEAPVADNVSPDTAGRVEPAFALPPDEELVAQPLPDEEVPHDTGAHAAHAADDDSAHLLMRESAAGSAPVPAAPAAVPTTPAARTPAARRAEKAAARRSKLTPTKIEPQPKLRVPEIDEPEFVKRSRQQEQSGRTRRIAMLAGSIVLLLLLVVQSTYTFRNTLAARVPALKPTLVSTCALLGCRVELPAQVDNLAIETGELTTLGGGVYSFTTELRNSGSTVQAWPSLELALTDADDKPLVRRVFVPRDYLAPGTALANGMAPRSEQAIKLHFRVDDLKPSGYHIAVFYP